MARFFRCKDGYRGSAREFSGFPNFSYIFLLLFGVFCRSPLETVLFVERKSKSLRKTVHANFQKLKTLHLEAA